MQGDVTDGVEEVGRALADAVCAAIVQLDAFDAVQVRLVSETHLHAVQPPGVGGPDAEIHQFVVLTVQQDGSGGRTYENSVARCLYGQGCPEAEQKEGCFGIHKVAKD